MKYLVQLTCGALIGLSSHCYAATNGINYDPNHNVAFTYARDHYDVATMTKIINADFAQLQKMGFTTIKTFYSTFCTDKPECVNVAQSASNAGLKVLLGVYEFPANPDYTVAQVNAAISAANSYKSTVVGIVVGNEDMFTYNGIPILEMQRRIVADIKTINSKLTTSITVTTAQRQPDWNRLLASNDPAGVLTSISVIGANIYPFWGDSPEKVGGKSVAYTIPTSVTALQGKTGKGVIVTEEGWPSCGDNPDTKDKTIAAETDYYHAWLNRGDSFDSYYFSAYDNPQGCADANNNFGLCLATAKTKSAGLVTCP